jgi:formylglycine-generating enzyme required for sulfatase activity
LVDHFGQDQIFMDIDSIEVGLDFKQVIDNAVSSCEILIVLIGKDWLSSSKGTQRRLDDPLDFVRLEITAALNRNIRVIPVLVQGASMPSPQDLPETIRKLSLRNAFELSDRGWNRDVAELIEAMQKIFAERSDVRRKGEREDEDKRQRLVAQSEAERVKGETEEEVELRKRRKRMLIILVGAFVIITIGVVGVVVMKRPSQPAVNQLRLIPSPSPSNSPEAPAGMVHVPGEESFTMGRGDGDKNNVDERPAHVVSVEGFFIDQHEVTCDEYAKFIQTGHPAPRGWENSKVPNGAGRKPVTNVKWDDANAYCNKYGKRLPREEEWELAARGTKGYIYPWGNVWEDRLANVQTNDLTEAGKFPGLSPYGAVDMVGNAWEWTASPLRSYPNGTLSEQPAPDWKVIRGGSYIDSPSQATTTYRVGYPASGATDYSKIGFRCVSDAPHASKPR